MPSPALAEMTLAAAGGRPADRVVARRRQGDPVAAVAQRHGAGDVGADEVPLDQVVAEDLRAEGDAVAVVGRDDVAGAGGRPADRVVARVGHVDPGAVVAQRLGAGDVGADEVPLDQVVGRGVDAIPPHRRRPLAEMTLPRIESSVAVNSGLGPTVEAARAVAQRQGAGDVGADEVALDQGTHRVVELDAVAAVGRDHVPRPGCGPADGRRGRRLRFTPVPLP